MPRSRARRLRRAALAGLALVVTLLIAMFGAVTCRPAWYRPASIDFSTLQDDKREPLRIENAISAALNAGETVKIELSETQVNRWIAARNEIWPGEVPSIEPIQRPTVAFLDANRVRVAAMLERGWMRTVLSVVLHVEASGDEVVVGWDTPRAGLLPIPVGMRESIRTRIDEAIGNVGGVMTDGACRITNGWTWPNGDRRFRVLAIDISDGMARVTLGPE